MPSAPSTRVTPLVAKGLVWFAIGVAGLFAAIRATAVLVQTGLDRRWSAHPNVAAALGWLTLLATVGGGLAVVAGVRRRGERPRPDDTDAPKLPGVASRRRLPDPLALLVAPLVAVVVTWPGVAHLSSRLIGATDAKYNAWLGWRMARAWRAGSWFPTRFADALYPIGVSLWLVDGLLPTWVTGVWNLLTGNPILAYNLSILTAVTANFFAAHHLAGALTQRRLVRLVGGAAFATAPAITGAIDAHITFVYAFTLPLLAREAIVSARGDRPLRPLRLAFLLLLAFLCSVYHLIFGGLLFLVVSLCWPRSSARSRTGLIRLAIGLGLAAVCLSPFIVNRLDFTARERGAGAPTADIADAMTYSNDALGTVSRPADATVRLPLPRTSARPQFELLRPAFAGLLLLGGVALACGVTHRGRRPLLVACAVLWLFGLGPTLIWGGDAVVRSGHAAAEWLPYRLLLAVPGLGALRAPYRVNFAFATAASALLVVGLDAVASRISRAAFAVATGGVIAALLVASLSLPTEHSGYDLSRQTRRGLERIASHHERTGSVMIVPFECGDDNRLSLWQTIHHHPLLGCSTVPAAIPWYSGMQAWVDSPELAALRCNPRRLSVRRTRFPTAVGLDAAGVRRLYRTLGVRYLIYDRVMALRSECGPVRDRVKMLARRAKVLSDDGLVEILDLGPSPGRR